jgi:hypothetical protein
LLFALPILLLPGAARAQEPDAPPAGDEEEVEPPPAAAPVRRTVQVARVLGPTLVRVESGPFIGLLGVETHPDSAFEARATRFLEKMARGKPVELEICPGAQEDALQLGYLYANGKLLNREMIRQGYAFVSKRHKHKLKADFEKEQRYAQAHRLGIWSPSMRREIAARSARPDARVAREQAARRPKPAPRPTAEPPYPPGGRDLARTPHRFLSAAGRAYPGVILYDPRALAEPAAVGRVVGILPSGDLLVQHPDDGTEEPVGRADASRLVIRDDDPAYLKRRR